MTRYHLIVSNIITTFILLIGLVVIIFLDAKSFNIYAQKNTEQLSQLTAENVSDEITKSMNQMVDVAHSMSCNDFFIDRLMDRDSYNYKADLRNYLNEFYREYDFDTVFLVSALTGNYYTQDGVVKQISPEDEHDVWYYNFVDKEVAYDIELDTSQSDEDQVTLFVNYRITSPDGRLLGVIGVGKRFDGLQAIVQQYQDKYDLSIYVINKGNAIQYNDCDTSLFIQEDELAAMLEQKNPIPLNDGSDMEAVWYIRGQEQVFVYTEYDAKFQWEVVILKEEDTLVHIFYERLVEKFGLFLLISIICGTMLNVVLYWKDKKVIVLENTDELTGLYNRKLFTKLTTSHYNRRMGQILFMMDVDHFKEVNDTQGHLFGNQILKVIGEELKKSTNLKGIVGRWGGDEFIGIIDMDQETAIKILTEFMNRVTTRTEQMEYPVTLSIGMVVISHKKLESDMQEADQQLYQSKKSGRNQISIK